MFHISRRLPELVLMLDLTRRRHMAFVLVTHDESLAARCDRMLRLKVGRLAG